MILPNNTRLQNRYVIVRLLGKGGFGAVYEAKDERLGHRVALKQLTLAGPQVLKAFEREARILARLKHAALPKVSDYFVHSNNYFLVMEYIEGDDLKMLLERRTTPLPLSDVLEWADQLLDALSYLHSQQPPVIHRDIKPGNIKLSPQGKVYLLDFGISKGGQTHTYQAMSGASLYAFSQHYASMEQIEGQGTDARSDLYSLAVTLHHLLTNQKPPQTVSRANAKLMNKPDPLRPVNELNPQVPASVAQVLTRALNFDPNLRPQSASAMQKMLKNRMAQRQAPTSVLRATSSTAQRTAPTSATGTSTLMATKILPPPTKQPTSPSRPLLVGFGVLLLLIVGGYVLFGYLFYPRIIAYDTSTPTATTTTILPQLPTFTPSPPATATPVAQDNTPQRLGSFSDLYFATSDDGVAQSTFPNGTQEIYAIWSYNDMQNGDTMKRIWYFNDKLYVERTEAWNFGKYGSSGTRRDVFLYDYFEGIDPGQWRIELYLNGEEQLVDEFTVE